MKEENNSLDFKCIICRKLIPKGKPYVCISKNIEHIEHNIISNQNEVEVIDSNILVTFCGACGNLYDDSTFIHLITSIPLLGRKTEN